MNQVEDSENFIQIYLFDTSGNFYWCNGSADVDIENQGVLNAGLFATLYRFSQETLNEKLNYLLINELRINMFTLVGDFLVAIVTPKFLKVDPRQIELIKMRINKEMYHTTDIAIDDILEHIIPYLNGLLEELFEWIKRYIGQANQAMNVFTSQIARIDRIRVGVLLYTWDGNRVFKYTPSSSTLEYQTDQMIDKAVNNIEFLTSLNRSLVIQNNTIIYFLVGDLILVVTKSFVATELENSVNDLLNSIQYFDELLQNALYQNLQEK